VLDLVDIVINSARFVASMVDLVRVVVSVVDLARVVDFMMGQSDCFHH